MVVSCVAYKCTAKPGQGFSFFSFPTDKDLREAWLKALGRGENFKPSKFSKLCSKHFTADDFQQYNYGYPKLKKGSVPTVFHLFPKTTNRKVGRSPRTEVKIQSTQSLADDANKYERFAASIESSSGEKNYVHHLKQEPPDDSFILPDVGGGSDEKRPPTHQFSMVASSGLPSQQSSGQGISLQDFVAGQYGSDDVVGSIISPQQVVIAQYGTPLVVGGSSTGLQNPVLKQSATTSSSLVRESATTSPSLVRLSPATAAASSLVRQPVATAAAASSQSNGQKRVCIIGPGGAKKKAAPSPSDDSTMTGASEEEGEEDDDFWEPEHPIDTFFRSMAQTVKKFPAALAAETKLEVCRLVTMMELKMLKGGKPDAKSSTPLGGDPTVGSSKSDCGSDDL